jgi:CMP-N,N'-diacetyllegionaminic acid synthase
MNIIIPARFGSKGLPFKNRKLFEYTANSIPEKYRKSVWVTSDDSVILDFAESFGFNSILRPDELATDTSSIREVMHHAIDTIQLYKEDDVVMLYLTYPQRTWQHILDAYSFFSKYSNLGLTQSLLCKKEINTSPFLYLQAQGISGMFGKQLIPHDLYRRQDYPECFEISHYISIFKAGSIYKLNRNLYCESTIFYPIPDVIDVDLEKDLLQFNGN